MVLLVFAYLFLKDRKALLKTAVVSGIMFLMFVFFSYWEFHQLLPDYYMPKRLSGGNFWVAIYGNLLSPGRGILVFSPFLAITALVGLACIRDVFRQKLLLLAAVWFILHLAVISKYPHWWAGWSFGPRLMTEALPALFVLTLFAWRRISAHRKKIVRSFLVAVGGGALVFSMYVNTYAALFNPWTGYAWNDTPNVNDYPEYLFDWKYPQFLHNKERHYRRLMQHLAEHPEDRQP
jgi:hypothetical protein